MGKDIRRAFAVPDILTLHGGQPFILDGPGPIVRMTLDDGTVLSIEHEGNEIVVRNLGHRSTSGITITPIAGNTISIHGTL